MISLRLQLVWLLFRETICHPLVESRFHVDKEQNTIHVERGTLMHVTCAHKPAIWTVEKVGDLSGRDYEANCIKCRKRLKSVWVEA